MVIVIKRETCEHLEEISRYNSNYYKLPFEVDGCSVLYESHDNLFEEFEGNTIGNMVDDKYVPKFWLHQYDNSETFLIDTSTIKEHNEWT